MIICSFSRSSSPEERVDSNTYSLTGFEENSCAEVSPLARKRSLLAEIVEQGDKWREYVEGLTMPKVDAALNALSAASVDRGVVTWVDSVLPSLSDAEQKMEHVAQVWYTAITDTSLSERPHHLASPAATTEGSGGGVGREGVDHADESKESGAEGARSGCAEGACRSEGEMEEGAGVGPGPSSAEVTAPVLLTRHRDPEMAHTWRTLTLATMRGQSDSVVPRVVSIIARWRSEGIMQGNGSLLQLPCARCGSHEHRAGLDRRDVTLLSFAHCGRHTMRPSVCTDCGTQQQGAEGHPLLVPAAQGVYVGLDLVAFVQGMITTLQHNLTGAASALRAAMVFQLFESGLKGQEGGEIISDSAVRTARRRVLWRASRLSMSGRVTDSPEGAPQVSPGCPRCEERGGPRVIAFDGAPYFRTYLPRLIPHGDEVRCRRR
jgi:hypothetical protein